VQHVSDLHPKFTLRKEKKKKPQGKNIMSASAMQGGHNKLFIMHKILEAFKKIVSTHQEADI